MEEEYNDDKARVSLSVTKLWKEITSFKQYFNWRDMIIGLLLGLFPAVFDISTDFLFAAELNKQANENRSFPFEYVHPIVGNITTTTGRTFAIATYYFLSAPGLVMALKMSVFLLSKLIGKICKVDIKKAKDEKDYTILYYIGEVFHGLVVCTFALTLMMGSYLLSFAEVDEPSFYLAVITCTFIIFVKCCGVFFHGPEMMKLLITITSGEGTFESAFQMIVFFMTYLLGVLPDGPFVWLSPISSTLMVAKASAENMLTFSIKSEFESASLLRKIFLLLKLTPVLALCLLFRMGTLALVMAWDDDLLIILLTVYYGPILLFCLLRVCLAPLNKLSPMDLVEAVAGEVSTPMVWGSLGREGSRGLNLLMFSFYQVHMFVLATLFVSN